jgi:hypothetical protein
MLARNKQVINSKSREISSNTRQRCVYIRSVKKSDSESDKICISTLTNKILKLKRDIKQLAAIQKAIKEEIRMNDGMDSYLLMLAKRD